MYTLKKTSVYSDLMTWMRENAHYTKKVALSSRVDASRHDRDAMYVHDLLSSDATEVDYEVRVLKRAIAKFNESYMFVPHYTDDNQFPNTCCDRMVQIPSDRILRDPGKAISIPLDVWDRKQRALALRADTGFCASMLLLWSCRDSIKSTHLKTLKPCHIVVVDGGAVGPIWCVRVALTTPTSRRSHLPHLHLGVAALGGDPNATENIWGHSHFDADRNGFLRVGYSLLWPLHPDDAYMQAHYFSENNPTTSLLDENRMPRDWRGVNLAGGAEGMIDTFFANAATHYPRATPRLRVDRLFATLVCRPSPPYAHCVWGGAARLGELAAPGEPALQPPVQAADAADTRRLKQTRSSEVFGCAPFQSLPDDIMLSIVEAALADDPRRTGSSRVSRDGVGKQRVLRLLQLRSASIQVCRVVHVIMRKQMEGLFELCASLREARHNLPAMQFERTCRLGRRLLHGQAAAWMNYRPLATIVTVEHMTRLHATAIAHHRHRSTAAYCTMLRFLFFELQFECHPTCGIQRTRLAAQTQLPYMGPRTRRTRVDNVVVTLRMQCPVRFAGACVVAPPKDRLLPDEDGAVSSEAVNNDLAWRTAALGGTTGLVYTFPCDASMQHPSMHVDRSIAFDDPLERNANE